MCCAITGLSTCIQCCVNSKEIVLSMEKGYGQGGFNYCCRSPDAPTGKRNTKKKKRS